MRNILRKLRHKKQEFDARIAMEKAAQHDVDTRLRAIEIRNKSLLPESSKKGK
jgi:hypothetical protein